MSLKDVYGNADLFNIVLLMLGPHALKTVRALADLHCDMSVKDTEWFSYFGLLRNLGYRRPFQWSVSKAKGGYMLRDVDEETGFSLTRHKRTPHFIDLEDTY